MSPGDVYAVLHAKCAELLRSGEAAPDELLLGAAKLMAHAIFAAATGEDDEYVKGLTIALAQDIATSVGELRKGGNTLDPRRN